MAYLNSREELPRPQFSIGSIVVEKGIPTKKLVPFRITKITHDPPDAKGRYWGTHHYLLEVAFPEDGDHFLNGKIMVEECLLPFDKNLKNLMIAAMYSRIEDIKELKK